MNTVASWPTLEQAEVRVLEIQTKLHQWAKHSPDRLFNDLYNLVCDPAFLTIAWKRVRTNQGKRAAGVDGQTAYYIESVRTEEAFLSELRADLKARSFKPLPVRERMIPKTNGKLRRLGIPTVRDRVVQASLKLVLEPILEADFQPCSYGFRPGRSARDVMAEIHFFTSRSYEWVVDADIEACFDSIDHVALMGRLRQRIGDKRVLTLVKSFLKAGILSEGTERETKSGTPQGGILSPLLANVALSVLDDHFIKAWPTKSHQREKRRRLGLPNARLVRYADDWVLMVAGTRDDAVALCEDAATVLGPMGLVLSSDKTSIVHIDEGFDFLGLRIQRQFQRGSKRKYVYTWPTKKALAEVKAKVRAITKSNLNQPLSTLIRQLNAVLRGWTNYFRHAGSAATFSYLRAFTWRRVICWIRRKHDRISWKALRRIYCNKQWWPTHEGWTLFNPAGVAITRYRWKGTTIPSPWAHG